MALTRRSTARSSGAVVLGSSSERSTSESGADEISDLFDDEAAAREAEEETARAEEEEGISDRFEYTKLGIFIDSEHPEARDRVEWKFTYKDTEKQKKIRFRKTQLMATVAHCDVRAIDVMRYMVKNYADDIALAVACNEEHEGGPLHVHLFVLFKERQQKTGLAWLAEAFGDQDGGADSHGAGRYQVDLGTAKAGHKHHVKGIEYCSDPKKGSKFCWYGVEDLEAWKVGKPTENDSAKASIIDYADKKKSFFEVMRDPSLQGYLLSNAAKVKLYLSSRRMAQAEEKEPWGPVHWLSSYSRSATTIQAWLNTNIRAGPRAPRQKQLWIHGPGGLGKTHLIEWLNRFVRIWLYNRVEMYQDAYQNGEYDLCVLDEFNPGATIPISTLNTLADGSIMLLPKKNDAALVKTDRLGLIVCSNAAPAEIYHSLAYKAPLVVQALESRFTVVNLVEEICPSKWSFD